MIFSTPRFWYSGLSIKSLILLPLSLIYYLISKFKKKFAKNISTKIKVICVGNLVVGGAGKTPACIMIGKILKAKNLNFAFISRGYNGKYSKSMKIDPKIHNSDVTGDEAQILAKIAPVYLAKNREEALLHAVKDKIDIVVMDDGLQNYDIRRHFNILVVDGNLGFGNNLLFPAGPLRCSLKSIIEEINLIIVVGDDKHNINFHDKKIINAQIKATNLFEINLEKQYFAFCGIANPEKFYQFLKRNNIKISGYKSFPDHHQYKEEDFEKLLFLSRGNRFITTEKDYVKLSKKHKAHTTSLKIEMRCNDIDFLNEFLTNKC